MASDSFAASARGLARSWLAFAAVALSLSVAPWASAATDGWETLPDGVLGRVATFQGRDHVVVAGYVRRPAGDGRWPLVILLHGGTPIAHATAAAGEALRASRQLGRSRNPPVPDFLAQGWAVYSIDFRPNPRQMIDPYEFDDTLAAIAQARAFPFVDPKRIALYGGSHGAHVMARMISRTQVACAVLCAPAGLDLIELSRAAARGVPIGANQRLIRDYEQHFHLKIADVAKDPAAVHYSSPLTEAAHARCPVLLISGKNDPNGPLPVMDEYVEKVRAGGQKAEVFHPDNGPHGFYFGIPRVIPETAEATKRAVAFIHSQFEADAR